VGIAHGWELCAVAICEGRQIADPCSWKRKLRQQKIYGLQIALLAIVGVNLVGGNLDELE
jgi:hypothetical protein